MIERSLSLMQEQLRLREIEVKLDLGLAEPVVLGNAIQLEQVFINLLTNARDALADVARAKQIRISGCGQRRVRRRSRSPTPAPASRRARAADLRPVLHHQGGRRGHGPRALDHLRHHQGARRHDRGRERAGRGRGVPHPASARPRGRATQLGASHREARHEPASRADRRRRPGPAEALPEALRLRMEGVTVETADSALPRSSGSPPTDYDAIVTRHQDAGDGRPRAADRDQDAPAGHADPADHRPRRARPGGGALRGGAYDFIQKPIDRDYFVASLRRAIEMAELSRQVKEQLPLKWLMGPSRKMQKVVQEIKQVADSPLTLLIQGETGTGKELVARATHQLSARRSKAFVAVDCGAIPDTLIESELFGYEKGAFTGAQQRKEGRFPLAEGGTLFLDEIVNLPLPTQSKLLRALQERQVQPLGSKQPVRVDARIIAASNVCLEREAKAGRFRQDVYYRLNEFVITLPPLRERDDILHLANDFLPKPAWSSAARVARSQKRQRRTFCATPGRGTCGSSGM